VTLLLDVEHSSDRGSGHTLVKHPQPWRLSTCYGIRVGSCTLLWFAVPRWACLISPIFRRIFPCFQHKFRI